MLLQATTDAAPNAGAWVLAGIAALAGALFMALKKKGEALDKPSIIYLLVPVPLFALISWAACHFWGKGIEAWDFLTIQLWSLIIGVAHAWLMYREVAGWRALAWVKHDSAWSWKHFGFTVLLMLAAITGLMLPGIISAELRATWSYWPATFTLLVPFLTVKAYDMYMGIPAAYYLPWYPMLDELFTYEPHPDFPKVNVRIVLANSRSGLMENISFDPNVRLERVYRWILHNHLRNEQELYYSEREGVNYVWGWHFHRQRRGWFRWQRRLDPKKTVKQCRLRAGDTLLAVRVEHLVPLDEVREQSLARGSERKND